LKFFGLYLDRNPQDRDFFKFIGLNYDTCHLAIEFEDAKKALDRITGAGIRLSKLHFSSALKLQPTAENVAKLHAFDEPVYFHQVIASYGKDEPCGVSKTCRTRCSSPGRIPTISARNGASTSTSRSTPSPAAASTARAIT
jgi:hypothetical protein